MDGFYKGFEGYCRGSEGVHDNLQAESQELGSFVWKIASEYSFYSDVDFFVTDFDENILWIGRTTICSTDGVYSCDVNASMDENEYGAEAFEQNCKLMKEYLSSESAFENGKNGNYCASIYYSESYNIWVVSKTNLWEDALKSDLFLKWFIFLTIIYIAALVVSVKFYSTFYDERERLNQAKIAFIRGVAHDMKTPIAIIKNCGECYLEGVAPEKNTEYVNTIMKEADGMNDSVVAFLKYNLLLETEKLNKVEVEYSELIEKLIAKHMPLAEQRNLRVEANIAPNVELKCEREMMEVAIGNYLSNAFKYASKNGKVKITLTPKGDLSVYNDCKPLSERTLTTFWYVLERGQIDRLRTDGSHGMGLPIVSRICSLHKFKCGAEAVKGGVEFYIKRK